MSVRLNVGHGVHADGFVIEDFEALAIGQVPTLPEVFGNNGLILREGHSIPRQGS